MKQAFAATLAIIFGLILAERVSAASTIKVVKLGRADLTVKVTELGSANITVKLTEPQR